MNNKALTIVMTLIAIVSSILLFWTALKLIRVDDRVDINKERIEQLEVPCTTADIKRPESTPGCE